MGGVPPVVDEGGDEGSAVIWLHSCPPASATCPRTHTYKHENTLCSLAPRLEIPATSLLMNINTNLMNVGKATGCLLRCDHLYTVHTRRDKRPQYKEVTVQSIILSSSLTFYCGGVKWRGGSAPFSSQMTAGSVVGGVSHWPVKCPSCFVNVEEKWADTSHIWSSCFGKITV